jgi:hypothetical protein
MLKNSNWNFETIRNIIDCASFAQDAGKDNVAKNVMIDLAHDILARVGEINNQHKETK